MFSQCKYQWCSSRIVTCLLSKNVLTILIVTILTMNILKQKLTSDRPFWKKKRRNFLDIIREKINRKFIRKMFLFGTSLDLRILFSYYVINIYLGHYPYVGHGYISEVGSQIVNKARFSKASCSKTIICLTFQ